MLSITRAGSGRFRAEFVNHPDAYLPIESDTFAGLFDALKVLLSDDTFRPSTEGERQREEDDDTTAADAAAEAVEPPVPWEQVKADLGL